MACSRVRAAKQAYKELLDMKQKQANVIEAHLAREQSEVAADQSHRVMIFTIFTIIFLPLSFCSSVFVINAREWSDPDTNYRPLHRVFTYLITVSLAFIIVALLAAFSRPRTDAGNDNLALGGLALCPIVLAPISRETGKDGRQCWLGR